MKIEGFTGGFVQTNCYLIETDHSLVLIDAPMGAAQWLEEKGVSVSDVLLTHQHYDHVEDAYELRAKGAKLHAWSPYAPALTLEAAARGFGLPIQVTPYEVDDLLEGKAELEVAGLKFELAHVPGHSLDSVTFYHRESGTLFSGDTLFEGGIGRTDLPGGHHKTLLENIDRKLMSLPFDTRVLPGHGGPTTIGQERLENPYLE